MEGSGLQVVAAGANVTGCGWSAGRKLAVASAVDLQPVSMLCHSRLYLNEARDDGVALASGGPYASH